MSNGFEGRALRFRLKLRRCPFFTCFNLNCNLQVSILDLLLRYDIWVQHDQFSRWVLERTALEDSLLPCWTRCAKQLLHQMSSISLERRKLRCHSGLILSQVLFCHHLCSAQWRTVPGDQRQRESALQGEWTGFVGGGGRCWLPLGRHERWANYHSTFHSLGITSLETKWDY